MVTYSEEQMNFTASFMLQLLKQQKHHRSKFWTHTHVHIYLYSHKSTVPNKNIGLRFSFPGRGSSGPPLEPGGQAWSYDHNVGYMGTVSWARLGSGLGFRNQSLCELPSQRLLELLEMKVGKKLNLSFVKLIPQIQNYYHLSTDQ